MIHRSSIDRAWRALLALALGLVLIAVPATSTRSIARSVPASKSPTTYTNPLNITIPRHGKVTSCADPSIMYAKKDKNWYVYCTSDPLNDNDPSKHLLPILRSHDLVRWTYVGDALRKAPGYATSDNIWAPDIHFFNGKYYLYYTVADTAKGSAIGVGTSSKPTGPFKDSGKPVVEPNGKSNIDPMEVTDNGQKYIFYGSYNGGVRARKLSANGLRSDKASQVQIVIPNRYEGTYIVKHGGYWYLFGSATNCCVGPLTGYSVFAGRSNKLLGPYVDRDGVSLLAGQVGGTPVISMNGNKWVGPGHNAVFTDFKGQDWFLYHAVDRNHPYFTGTDTTMRPALLDPLDWVDGWPAVRGGLWASDTSMPAPAAQPNSQERYTMAAASGDTPGQPIASLSDEFDGSTLSSQWQWVRQPAASAYGLAGGTFRFDTEDADLFKDTNNASVLTEPTPQGSYIVETRVKLSVPPEGCCHNYVQAGLVIYKDDDNFIKLAHVSIYETRQTEFAKEMSAEPRYGNSVVGPPGDWTWLRIVKTTQGSQELYRAYTSRDGATWVRGGVWTHQLGGSARIGLVSMGGSGFTANFDYVHVYQQQS